MTTRLRATTEQLRQRLDAHSRSLGIDPRCAEIEGTKRELVEAARRAARARGRGESDKELARVVDAAVRLEALNERAARETILGRQVTALDDEPCSPDACLVPDVECAGKPSPAT